MIHFEGERTFTQPVGEVATKLSDASFLVSCIGGVEEVVTATPDSAVWKLRPGFSFIRGTLTINMTIAERVANTSTKVKMVSKGIGASTTVIAELRFAAREEGTAVRWVADVTEITGLLKMVPKGLIQSTASKVIEETWVGIEKKLGNV
jgi:carbon monoxide dehydrogenase subunit G